MAYFVVNHLSDEEKTDGLVESYQIVNVEVQQEDGTSIVIPKRLNYVHWPLLPVPFVHEEWSDNLSFSTIYTPENDSENSEEDEDEDENYLNESIVELLKNDHPEIYNVLLQEASLEQEEDEEEYEEDEEEYEDDQASL